MIDSLPLLAMSVEDLWFAVPLIVSISLVYAATRHEELRPIFRHALGCATWIVGLMAAIMVLLMLISWWV